MIPLTCPTCRASTPLRLDPVGLACVCGARFPVVDDTPIVLREVDAWLDQERATVLLRRDLPPQVLDRLLATESGPITRSRLRLRSYADRPEDGLCRWLTAELATVGGPILDLCCGAGVHGRDNILGVDLDWLMLQRYPGPRVLADATDPPFAPASFGAVLLINAIDSVRDPSLLLGQADALLQPGGTLLLTSPFSWSPEITPAAWTFDEATLLVHLERLGYALAVSEVEWRLSPNPRTTLVHRCLALRATKGPPATNG